MEVVNKHYVRVILVPGADSESVRKHTSLLKIKPKEAIHQNQVKTGPAALWLLFSLHVLEM